MADLAALRATIAATPKGAPAAIVTREWLENVYEELAACRAAQAQAEERR